MKPNNYTPLQSLEKLSSLTRGDRAMESRPTSEQTWRGFIFNISGINVVFPFMGGYEILPDRDVQLIPWAKDWVRGVTNVRGEIYTVVDFSAYLGLAPVTSMRRATMFLLPDTTVKCVLLLEDRVNLRNFPQFAKHVTGQNVPKRLASCLNVILKDDDQDWLVIDVAQLCRSQEFLSIAA